MLMTMFTSFGVQADVATASTKIDKIYSYATAGNGDVLIVPSNTLAECDGFWLDNEDPGFQTNLSVALSAYHANSPVQIYGNEQALFTGSSQKFCKLTILVLLKK